jgi:hypothetical protein
MGSVIDLKPVTLPLIVAAIVIPVTAAFLIAGPMLGLFAGLVAAGTLVLLAASRPPRGAIETAARPDSRRRVLIALSRELDEPAAIERVWAEAQPERGADETEVLVLAPARTGLLARWASDVEAARAEAQRKLVISVASLAGVQVEATGAVGDQDLVQAVEDELHQFAADEVILVTGPVARDSSGERAAGELATRLRQPLVRIVEDADAG